MIGACVRRTDIELKEEKCLLVYRFSDQKLFSVAFQIADYVTISPERKSEESFIFSS